MSKIFAILNSENIVINVIEATSWSNGIDITSLNPRPGINWVYDPVNRIFAAPVAAEIPDNIYPEITETSLMTQLAFLNKFTFEELSAIESAPSDLILLKVAKLKFHAAREIDVSRLDTQQYVMVLVHLGILSEIRAAEILSPISIATSGAIHPQTLEVTF